MSTEKKTILEILSKLKIPSTDDSLISDKVLKSIEVDKEKISIVFNIENPTLHLRKKIEKLVLDSLNPRFPSHELIVIVESKKKKEGLDSIKNIIAVASGKGGVGKSTVSSNLAVSLVQKGYSVGLLDGDIYGPSIPIMFDIADARPLSVNIEGKNKMKPIESYGVKVLSIGFFTKPDQAVIWRGPMASKALNQMIFDATWGELDFLLVDLPPGTGDIHLSILQALPVTGSVIVSTPQNIALADARKGIAMFNQKSINVPVLGIVENMAFFTPNELPENKYYIFGKDGAKNLSDDMNVKFLGEVPILQSVREASDFGHPASLQENSKISLTFNEISKNLVSELVKRNKDLPPSEILKITTMAGCSAVNK